EQGKKYYYRNITWIGNSKNSTDMLQDRVLQMYKGDVYDSETMSARLGIGGKTKMGDLSVSGLYTDDGYLAFTIEPIETVVGDSVDVEIRIIEGRQFRIRNVDFDGNTRTNDRVIRRELETVPGDLYSQSLLVRTYQRLAQMGQFDAKSFATPDVQPNMQQETVDIKYSLTEVSNDQFELSGGWGGGMFIASVGVNFTNISLRKFFDPKAWRPYPAGDNQTIGLKIQTNGTYYRALSVNFMEPWLGGRKPTSFAISFFTSRETDAYMLGQKATRRFGTIGGAVSLGKRLMWPDPYFTLSVGIQAQTYNMMNWAGFVLRDGTSNTIALNATIARNSIDDPYQYPSSGSNISLSLVITPPYSLFDGVDYSQPMSQQDRYRWIEYHKWRLNAQWFFPLSADNKLVLMARAQFGYLGYFNKNKRSPFEGYQMGG
ncbi:MAG: POTRA domain-containing protein, partial [Mucinivorans sp.]